VRDGSLRLDGLVASLSGEAVIRDSNEGAASDAGKVGEALAARMLERGAATLLEGVTVRDSVL
jgi:hydroxymethylbilane synthase